MKKLQLLAFTLLLSSFLFLPMGTASDVPFTDVPFDVTDIPEPAPPPKEVRDFFNLDPYYQQWINVRGFPVLASAEVRPYTVKEAAWTIGHMVGHRPDILKAMAQIKARFSIVPHNKHLPDIPEYDFGRLDFFMEIRARGIGGQTTTSPEENIICGDSNYCYAELIHEFAHQIHHWGLNRIDSTFDSRLETMLNAALQEGLYQENYAGTNRHEYWAEGVGSWFNGPNRISNVAHTREALKEYDPRLATLLTEIFGDGSWRYAPPATRIHLPHLQGFNPQEAPIYQRPPELLELEKQLLDPDSNGGGKWVNLELYHPSALSHLKKQTKGGNRTDFLVRNLTEINLALYFFKADGKKILYQYIGTNSFLHVGTEVGAIWLIQDHTGQDFAVFRAEKEVGRVLVTPTLRLITPGLSIVSGDNQSGISSTVLTNPLVIEVRDENLSVRTGISVTFTVTAGGGTLSVERVKTNYAGRAESRLTLGPNRGTNTVSVSAAGIEQSVTFTAVAEAAVNIPDSNFRAAIEDALGVAPGTPIVPADMATLTRLEAGKAGIRNLTGLESATNLEVLVLVLNSISDLTPLVGLTNLKNLALWDNSISDISAVKGLTNLTELSLGGNSISDISPVAALTDLTSLHLPSNHIADISFLSGLTRLTYLNLNGATIRDLSFLSGLTNLRDLYLGWNNITDISVLSGLTNLTVLWLMDNNISDLSPLVANTGLGSGDMVDVGGNPLSYQSINTHIPLLQSRGVEVRFENLKPTASEYTLSIPAGTSLIHVPLKVTAVDGVAKTVTTISDLYDALGGADTVNFFITYDSQAQDWRSYFVPADRGGPADARLTDDKGIITSLRTPVSVRLRGNPLGTNGNSTITLNQGLNLVGLPLRDERINRVSDLLRINGIWGNVPVIVVTNGGDFKVVGRVGDPGDIAITGGQAFILNARQTATVAISGEAWTNVSETVAAPPVIRKGIKAGDATPVLGLRGSVVDEEAGLKMDGFRVTVKNLSTGRTVTGMTKDEETGYQLTVVDIETARAATIGDILEITAQSPNPFIGVQSLRYTVTAEDVRQSWIQLPALLAYEIPSETELLPNYPNPFNPETWIPYRLAEDAFVTLTIYDLSGQVVRTLDVGHRIASAYESRSKAIYWDGRNGLGEQVASGVYFYILTAGDFSATRRMLILK